MLYDFGHNGAIGGPNETVNRDVITAYLGPVVQSIISLTSSLRGQFIKCCTTL